MGGRVTMVTWVWGLIDHRMDRQCHEKFSLDGSIFEVGNPAKSLLEGCGLINYDNDSQACRRLGAPVHYEQTVKPCRPLGAPVHYEQTVTLPPRV